MCWFSFLLWIPAERSCLDNIHFNWVFLQCIQCYRFTRISHIANLPCLTVSIQNVCPVWFPQRLCLQVCWHVQFSLIPVCPVTKMQLIIVSLVRCFQLQSLVSSHVAPNLPQKAPWDYEEAYLGETTGWLCVYWFKLLASWIQFTHLNDCLNLNRGRLSVQNKSLTCYSYLELCFLFMWQRWP